MIRMPFVLAAIVVLSTFVHAQSNEELKQRIDQLEKQLEQLKAQIGTQAGPSAPAEPTKQTTEETEKGQQEQQPQPAAPGTTLPPGRTLSGSPGVVRPGGEPEAQSMEKGKGK